VSAHIHEIFNEYTNLIEPLSLDEAYIDVSEANFCQGSASLMAKEIREKIYQKTALTASAGISYNKFLAKLGSDQNKPNGQFVIKPGDAEQYLHNLPIGRFYGIGKVTEAKLKASNIHTGGDLKKKSLFALQKHFGRSAEYYYNIARGIDNRPVTKDRIRKSLGAETTFQQDLSDINEMKKQLTLMLDETLTSLSQRGLLAYTFTIKVKYADFKQVTRSYTGDSIVSDTDVATPLISNLLKKTEAANKPVRLLGISFSNLIMRDSYSFNQLPLF
jgi:DNA polymerase-4